MLLPKERHAFNTRCSRVCRSPSLMVSSWSIILSISCSVSCSKAILSCSFVSISRWSPLFSDFHLQMRIPPFCLLAYNFFIHPKLTCELHSYFLCGILSLVDGVLAEGPMKTGLMQPESTVGSKGFYRDQAFEASRPIRTGIAMSVSGDVIATRRLSASRGVVSSHWMDWRRVMPRRNNTHFFNASSVSSNPSSCLLSNRGDKDRSLIY
jgi:hypothetical protein